jgi:hypothetical protein
LKFFSIAHLCTQAVESKLIRNEREEQCLSTLNDPLHVRFGDAFCALPSSSSLKPIVESQMLQLLDSKAEFGDAVVAQLLSRSTDSNNASIDSLVQLFASRGRLLQLTHAILEYEVKNKDRTDEDSCGFTTRRDRISTSKGTKNS